VARLFCLTTACVPEVTTHWPSAWDPYRNLGGSKVFGRCSQILQFSHFKFHTLHNIYKVLSLFIVISYRVKLNNQSQKKLIKAELHNTTSRTLQQHAKQPVVIRAVERLIILIALIARLIILIAR